MREKKVGGKRKGAERGEGEPGERGGEGGGEGKKGGTEEEVREREE